MRKPECICLSMKRLCVNVYVYVHDMLKSADIYCATADARAQMLLQELQGERVRYPSTIYVSVRPCPKVLTQLGTKVLAATAGSGVSGAASGARDGGCTQFDMDEALLEVHLAQGKTAALSVPQAKSFIHKQGTAFTRRAL